MKSLRKYVVCLWIIFVTAQAPYALAGWKDLLEDVKGAVGLSGELSDSTIIQGLKEALQIGTGNAVKLVSQMDGYYKNPDIKILLPDTVKKVEKALRLVGYGPQVDAFELSMNRAAEQAVPKAKELFWDSIKQMTVVDAKKILNGKENEATLYFENKTRDRLMETFRPIVHTSMSQVGVTRSYQALEEKVRKAPFIKDLVSVDLDQYVTDRALNGLFLMLAEEERKIRTDPAARVTKLLKDVFGKKN
ncbi:MAG: DUF4197 domain-containing protein [Desulfatiglans sp.]|jgi:hypothetical protein|nr:DUF4197 domain-containing protein [Thermodesulfobacteriota bacterium]MEE4351533.1 DUF4197 domain-containing protein [Desulfatiglans sp.]